MKAACCTGMRNLNLAQDQPWRESAEPYQNDSVQHAYKGGPLWLRRSQFFSYDFTVGLFGLLWSPNNMDQSTCSDANRQPGKDAGQHIPEPSIAGLIANMRVILCQTQNGKRCSVGRKVWCRVLRKSTLRGQATLFWYCQWFCKVSRRRKETAEESQCWTVVQIIIQYRWRGSAE